MSADFAFNRASKRERGWAEKGGGRGWLSELMIYERLQKTERDESVAPDSNLQSTASNWRRFRNERGIRQTPCRVERGKKKRNRNKTEKVHNFRHRYERESFGRIAGRYRDVRASDSQKG